jgi:hypothetical protein
MTLLWRRWWTRNCKRKRRLPLTQMVGSPLATSQRENSEDKDLKPKPQRMLRMLKIVRGGRSPGGSADVA